MQNNERRERAATYAIMLWLATSLCVAVSGAMLVASLGGTGAIWSEAALEGVDRFTAIAAGIYFAAYILCAVCVARWLYRASANAHAVSDQMKISPGWGIGFFFVPVVNLWKPFQALRETWQASLSPEAPDNVPVPTTMRIWWGLWLLASVLGNISFRLSAGAKTVADVTTGGWLDIVSFVVDLPLAVSLIVVIRQLSANQRALIDTRIFE